MNAPVSGPRDWPLARAMALVVLGWGALAFPWLSGRVTVPWDAKAHFQPQLAYLAGTLHRGESPFWNPFVFAGSPHVADPQSLIFSPLHLIAAALVPDPGLVLADAIAYGMLLVGAFAVLLLFRDRGWHWSGAVVAALAFAFGGSAAWRIQHTGQILSLAWFVPALWTLERAIVRRTAFWGFAAGAVAGLMVLGRDQVAFLGCWVLLGRVVWMVAAGPDRLGTAVSLVKPLAMGVLGGVLVCGVPLVLTLLLAGETSRASIIDLAGAERGSLHPASLLTAFVANLYGTDGPLADFWGQPSFAWGPTDLFLARNMSDVYMGALPIVALLALGVARGALAAREVRFLVVALVLLLLFALGRYTPAFQVMFHLPGVGLFRRPADATFLIGAVAAILAGYCVHRHVTGTLPSWTAPTLAAATLLVGGGLAACVAVAAWKDRLGQAAGPLAMGLAFMAASVAALWAAPRLARRSATAAGMVLAGLLTLDLALGNGPNESTALPPSTYDVLRPDTANETIAAIRKRIGETAGPDRRDRVELAGIDFHWPNASMVHRLDHTLGYNPIHLDTYTRATGAQDHVALPDQRTFSPLFPSYRSLLADMLGLRVIATRVPVEQMDKALKPGDLIPLGRTKDAFLYENPRALPRVLFATQALGADGEAIIASGRWPEFDPRTTVLLDALPGLRLGSAGAGPGTVRLVSYEPTRVEVEADSPAGGWVVLHDVWYPWWRATVDGAPAPILKANVLFRAVAVPAGKHRVSFTFHPFSGALAEVLERFGLKGR
ncbi:hypothetical protein [uncultured Alsobacter sp.]|uniref:hypothetical protein n=1 Tax=uncultured Alsobacter sp. TaxID=1748258 RepID=UPI0025EC73F8|nr:hypothetical protein [uncultured Alsobacter sp.]